MPFRKEHANSSSCAFQQQQSPFSSSSHGAMFHHSTSYNNNNNSYFSISSTTTTKDEEPTMFQFDNNNFMFPTPEEEKKKESIFLPFGWTLAGKKRSLFELETNIHTLGELYTTLIELRHQLPLLQQEQPPPPPFISRRSSSFTAFDSISRRSSSSNPSIHSLDEGDDMYYNLTSTYPEFIYISLLHLCSTTQCIFINRKKNLIELFQQDTLNKAYASALFAYVALYAFYFHSDQYGIYSFLAELASDAYIVSHELLQFDVISFTTVETLLLMYQYLILLRKESEAKNLFSLAWRHMEILLENKTFCRYGLLVWMMEIDWHRSMTQNTVPIIDPKKYVSKIKLFSSQQCMQDTALKYRTKGLYLILNHVQLNDWRSTYLKHFLYKRITTTLEYTVEDKLALRLHALYFSGMLHYYQSEMMTAFEFEQEKKNEQQWTDYFTTTTTNTYKTGRKVEKSLYSCMNAAYGFTQVVKLLLDEQDTCQFVYMMDTLSAAYTVLYFGNKVTITHSVSLPQRQKDILVYIIEKISTLSMMQCPPIARFVHTWHHRMQ